MEETFPFIALETRVDYKGDKDFVVRGVDYTRKVFTIAPYNKAEPWVYNLPFSEYKPAPTMENFDRMLQEWDYYYNMSDYEPVVERGRQQERMLKEMFEQLSPEDKLYFRKAIAIITNPET